MTALASENALHRDSVDTNTLQAKPGESLLKRLAFVHHKGGTGKTSACLNVAGGLCLAGNRVLVVDLDPQASATTGLGLSLDSLSGSAFELLNNTSDIRDCIYETRSGVYVLPSSSQLLLSDSTLSFFSHADALYRHLQRVEDYFDVILIDTPPGHTLLTVNALVAARNIIIPVDSGVFSYEALDTLGQLITEVERAFQLQIFPIAVLIKQEPLFALTPELKSLQPLIERFRAEHSAESIPIYSIPYSRKVRAAQCQGLPLSHYAPGCRTARAYQRIIQALFFAKAVAQ